MITIINQADIEALSASERLPPVVLQLLRSEFAMLADSYNTHPGQLNLALGGPICLAEPGDDLTDIPQIGLPADSGGLLGSHPETVHKLILDDGSSVYRVQLLQNNEFAPTLFLCSRSFDLKMEHWLASESDLTANCNHSNQID